MNPVHVVVMGVSGSGKTTVAAILGERFGWRVIEADDLHPQANIDKMSSGQPLNDADRAPWLEKIRATMASSDAVGESTVVTCSALKRAYRDVLRGAGENVVFMHLHGPRELLEARLSARTGHFMPPGLLDSQFDTLELLDADERGAQVDITPVPADIVTDIVGRLTDMENAQRKHDRDARAYELGRGKADIGLYGLGVMGSALARNLARKGYRVAVANLDPAVTDEFVAHYSSEGEFVAASGITDFAAVLSEPRVALVMVTAGDAVDSVAEQLAAQFDSGDVIVDMGNSHFADTRRREATYAERGINFVGCGTSGGEEGALNGPALMVGGSRAAYDRLGEMLESIAAQADDGRACCVHVGPDGAGHFAKTIHNGIEYADMQLISEAYALLTPTVHDLSAQFARWNDGELNSFLMSITADILAQEDEPGRPMIDVIDDVAGQKGTGMWTAQSAIGMGVDAGVLVSALLARFASASAVRDAVAVDAYSGGRTNDGAAGGADFVEDVRRALYVGKIVAYAQGFDVIDAASAEYGWGIDKSALALTWRAGCIIRADILDVIADIFAQSSAPGALFVSEPFATKLRDYVPSLRRVVAAAALAGTPVPAFSSALTYVDTLAADRLPTALIQAQRDYFGAHGFRRVDAEGVFHREWQGQL